MVGGAPRSGTTALSRMLELHTAVRSTGTETGTAKILANIQDCIRTSPDIDQSGLQRYLETWVKGITLQLSWNIREYGLNPELFSLNTNNAKAIAGDIGDYLYSLALSDSEQLHTITPLNRVLRMLHKNLEEKENHTLFLEKTPNNSVYAHRLISSGQKPTLVLITRSPVNTISSMRMRSIKNDDWSGDFHGHALKLAWIYISHYKVLRGFPVDPRPDWLSLQTSISDDNIVIVNYEKMSIAPMQSAIELALNLDIEVSNHYLGLVKDNIIRALQDYSTNEFRRVSNFTTNELFFLELLQGKMEGASLLSSPSQQIRAPSVDTASIPTPMIVDCQGIYREKNGQVLIDNNAAFCIITGRRDKSLNFRIHCPSIFPAQANILSIKIFKDNRSEDILLERLSIKPCETIEVEVPLDPELSIASFGGICVYYVMLVAEQSFIPMLLRNSSEDERLLALAVELTVVE